jgi:hypothetical protein
VISRAVKALVDRVVADSRSASPLSPRRVGGMPPSAPHLVVAPTSLAARNWLGRRSRGGLLRGFDARSTTLAVMIGSRGPAARSIGL